MPRVLIDIANCRSSLNSCLSINKCVDIIIYAVIFRIFRGLPKIEQVLNLSVGNLYSKDSNNKLETLVSSKYFVSCVYLTIWFSKIILSLIELYVSMFNCLIVYIVLRHYRVPRIGVR